MPYLDITDQRSLSPRKITEQVEAPSKGKATIYWVRGLGVPKGVGLRVRAPTKQWNGLNASWIVQVDGPPPAFKTRRVKIGHFGEVTFDDVLEQARELRKRIREGENPAVQRRQAARGAAARNSFTVGDLVDLYKRHLQRHGSRRTAKNFEYESKYLEHWFRRPLASLTKPELKAEHERITDEHGPVGANKIMRTVRAAWNHALALHEDLPRNLLGADRGWKFNAERRGGERVQWAELPDWWAKVHALENLVRRDLNLLALFTGFRASDCMSLRWEDVNFDEGTIHRPNPKGGHSKAFTVPVSGFVLDLLRRRRAENRADRGWVFPTDRPVKPGRDPHVQNMIEHRYVDGQKVRVLPSPHMLRRTFATACTKAGVEEHQRHFLMNHGPKQAHVADRYVVPGVDDLREATEDVTRFLLNKAGVAATIHSLNARSSVG